MPFKTTVNWLINDICYLAISCFDWKIVVFQQTVVRVYYILKTKHHNRKMMPRTCKEIVETHTYTRCDTPFPLKSLFVLKILKFLPWIFGHVGKRLDKKAKFNFKNREVTIFTFPNISRIKDDQQIKFRQLIKYNVRIFFFKNYAENDAGRLDPDLFLVFEKLCIK